MWYWQKERDTLINGTEKGVQKYAELTSLINVNNQFNGEERGFLKNGAATIEHPFKNKELWPKSLTYYKS